MFTNNHNQNGQNLNNNQNPILQASGYDGHEPTRLCPHCGKEKPQSEFGWRKMPNGEIRNQSWCRECRSKSALESRKPSSNNKCIKEVEQGESSEKAQKQPCSTENLNRTGFSGMGNVRPQKSVNKTNSEHKATEQNGQKPQTPKDVKTPEEESRGADQSNDQS